jgi:hypothetical protein
MEGRAHNAPSARLALVSLGLLWVLAALVGCGADVDSIDQAARSNTVPPEGPTTADDRATQDEQARPAGQVSADQLLDGELIDGEFLDDEVRGRLRQALSDRYPDMGDDAPLTVLSVQAAEPEEDGSGATVVVTTCVELIDTTVEPGRGRFRYLWNRVVLGPGQQASDVVAIDPADRDPARDQASGDSLDGDAFGCLTEDRAAELERTVEGFLAVVEEGQRHPDQPRPDGDDLATAPMLDALEQSMQGLAATGIYYDDPQEHHIVALGADPLLDDGFVVETCTDYPEGTSARALTDGSVSLAESPFAAGTLLYRTWQVISRPGPAGQTDHLVAELRTQTVDGACDELDSRNE